ncbi:PAS domain-containing protein [Pedobacter sp. SYP-B3415]|uniref:PAS domain-containing sensor histidine kinase n=1 Tax=Pedobacter sp. SYP-B3415 TaxID=2496641 RepID=UPI00101DE38B|nr:PAS domain-containing protein [Pedobacter sp. SYP-B3415]
MNDDKKNTGQEKLDRLQSETLSLLNKILPDPGTIDQQTFARMFQELQTYQMELEMQNDELIHVNEQLEWQRLRFSGIYDLAPIGYLITDTKGYIIELNSAAAALFKSGKHSLTGKSLYALIAEDDRDTYYTFFRRILSSALQENCHLRLSNGDEQVHVHAEGIFVKAADQCYIAFTDITNTMQVKQDLMKASHRLSLALDASGSGAWELSQTDMVFSLDAVIEDMLGTGHRDYRFAAIRELVGPADRERFSEDFRSAFFDRPVDATYRFACPGQAARFIWIRGSMKETMDGRRILSGIMTDITERKLRQDNEDRLAAEHQRALVIARHLAEEKERNRISSALHDTVSQLLYGIQIKITQINNQRSETAMKEISELMRDAIKITRNISFELAPSILLDFGLPAALDELATRFSNSALRIESRTVGFANRISPAVEANVFRIVQELVNNSIKHTQPSRIDILLKQSGHKIEISVTDNGSALLADQSDTLMAGTGLDGINSRIGLYDGKMSITPVGASGTTIRVEITES